MSPVSLAGFIVLVTLTQGRWGESSTQFRGVVLGESYAGTPVLSSDRPAVMVRWNRDGVSVDDWVGLRGTALVWHLDPNVRLSASELRPGTRVHVFASYWVADSIVVYSLGSYAFTASVEDWIVENYGGRPWEVLSRGQLATIAALGSESWFVRQAVSDALERRGVEVLRLLIWARHSLDPEIRKRAELLLTRLGWDP